MTASNIQKSVNLIKRAIKEGKDHFSTVLRVVNTGSNKYQVCAAYDNIDGIFFRIEKCKSNGQFVGILYINRYSYYGCEYDNTVIGQLPDSVVKEILSFVKAFNFPTKKAEYKIIYSIGDSVTVILHDSNNHYFKYRLDEEKLYTFDISKKITGKEVIGPAKKEIVDFIKVKLPPKPYEVVMVDNFGSHSELIKARKTPTIKQLEKAFEPILSENGYKITQINPITEEQYNRYSKNM